ncbi:MAG: hypothetical protein HY647_01615 [Acidobacteria bacterium]|nr:hypothetical protein [Acidobacteriota bacterium]
MWNWIKSLFQVPEPAGPPQLLRRFAISDRILTQDGVSVASDGWRMESTEKRTIRLYEVSEPGVEQCILTYRAQIKTANLQKGAYLEMWCRFPGRGEFFSKGLHHRVKGTTEWASYETPFYLRKGQRPDLVKLNLVTEGRGTLWLRNVELFQAPLKS